MRALALALLLAAPAAAAELYPPAWTPVATMAWGGLNILNDSTSIGNDAQKAQNVLTDNGFLEKRPGNVLISTVITGYPVKFVDDWVAPNGTRYLISQASQTVYQTNFSSASVALGTVTANSNVNSIAAFSKRLFADGVNYPWYWDGTSTGTIVSAAGTPAPICTYMAFKDSRVFCGNIPNDGRSRVRISSAGGSGYWIVPSDVADVDNAPNVFDFTPDDGDSIQCMATTPWGVFVGKRYSSSMIKGIGNLSYELRILDPKIGCVDNHSVQMVNGTLQWLSLNGVYGFNGAGPAILLSRELDPVFRNLALAAARSQEWRVDTQLDFQDGNLVPSGSGAPMSATIAPGALVPSTATRIDTSSTNFAAGTIPTLLTTATTVGSLQFSTAAVRIYNGDFEDGVCSAGTYWTCSTSGSGVNCQFDAAGSIGGSCGATVIGNPGTTAVYIYNEGFTTILSSAVLSGGQDGNIDLYALGLATQTLAIRFQATNSGGTANLDSSTFTAVSSISWQGASPTSGSTGFSKLDNVKVNRYFSMYQSSATPQYFLSQVFDMAFSTPTGGTFDVAMTSGSGTGVGIATNIRSSVNGSTAWTAFASIANAAHITQTNRYYQYGSTFTTSVGTFTPTVESVTLNAATTGYYHSPVHFIGSNITSYGQFAVTQNIPNGSTVTYSVRTTTYSFTDLSGVNIPWVAQTDNLIPTIAVSTPVYIQWRSLLDFNFAENIPTVYRVATNFNEGTAQPVASGVNERRYFLCVTVSSNSTNNDTCYVRQQNGKWVTWTGPSIGAMGLYDYNLVVGDGGTSGKVWKVMQNGVYIDDGTAIDAQWVSQDFTNNAIFNDKVLHEFWVDAAPVSLSSVTISYQVNKSSGFIDYQFYLDNGEPVDSTIAPAGIMQYGKLNQWVPLSAGFDKGKYARIKFADAQISNYFRINAFLLFLENKGREVPN